MEHDDSLRITTPEGIELELSLAGIGSRSIAGALDLAMQGVLGLGGVVLVGALLDGGVATAVVVTLGFVLVFGYDVAFEVLAAGRTPGKRATGLRVVRESGAPVPFLTSAVRNVLRLIDILPFAYGLGMLVVFLTRRNQRLGDLAAGTVVVRERHGGRRRAGTAPAAVPAVAVPAGWDTSGVTAEDLAVARAFLQRRHELQPGPRARLAEDLAARLRAKTAGAGAGSPEAFLEQLVSARDARR